MKTLLATLALLAACVDPSIRNDYHSDTALGIPDPCVFDWEAGCVDEPSLRELPECERYKELWATPDMLPAQPSVALRPELERDAREAPATVVLDADDLQLRGR